MGCAGPRRASRPDDDALSSSPERAGRAVVAAATGATRAVGRSSALNLIGESPVVVAGVDSLTALGRRGLLLRGEHRQRELLVRCLDAIAAERAALPFETEVLVLDNASGDGSAGTARSHPTVTEVIVLDLRQGKSENDTACSSDYAAASACCSTKTPSYSPAPPPRCTRAYPRTRRPPRPAPSCCGRTAPSSLQRGASRRRPPRSSARSSCTSG